MAGGLTSYGVYYGLYAPFGKNAMGKEKGKSR